MKWIYLGAILLVSCGSKPPARPFSGENLLQHKKEKKQVEAVSSDRVADSAAEKQ